MSNLHICLTKRCILMFNSINELVMVPANFSARNVLKKYFKRMIRQNIFMICNKSATMVCFSLWMVVIDEDFYFTSCSIKITLVVWHCLNVVTHSNTT